MASENEKLVRRWFEEIWNRRRPEVAHELAAADCVCHSESGPLVGVEPFLEQVYQPFVAALPDVRLTVEGTVAEGDQVVVRWVATGTHTGGGLGIPPTGRRVTFRGMTWVRCANGKMVEGCDCWNQAGLLQALQGGPAPPSMALTDPVA
jgi:steroid delta-isomerase-like uncharacterized protein